MQIHGPCCIAISEIFRYHPHTPKSETWTVHDCPTSPASWGVTKPWQQLEANSKPIRSCLRLFELIVPPEIVSSSSSCAGCQRQGNFAACSCLQHLTQNGQNLPLLEQPRLLGSLGQPPLLPNRLPSGCARHNYSPPET